MTDKILNSHWSRNKDFYIDLTANCASTSELFIKIAVAGKKLSKWDWAILLLNILRNANVTKHFFDCQKNIGVVHRQQDPISDSTAERLRKHEFLHEDLLNTVNNSAELDSIVTNKHVVLSLIYSANSINLTAFSSIDCEKMTKNFLAHVFKKFPSLWNMSWMWIKHKDFMTKKTTKVHRLGPSCEEFIEKNI